MGGKYGRLGGRPRKPRAAEMVAESAKEHAPEIVAAFLNALGPEQPPYVQLQAAKEWLKIENEESKLQLQEDRAYDDAGKDELIAELTGTILRLQDAGYFADALLDEPIDAEVIEDGQIGTGGDDEEVQAS